MFIFFTDYIWPVKVTLERNAYAEGLFQHSRRYRERYTYSIIEQQHSIVLDIERELCLDVQDEQQTELIRCNISDDDAEVIESSKNRIGTLMGIVEEAESIVQLQ